MTGRKNILVIPRNQLDSLFVINDVNNLLWRRKMFIHFLGNSIVHFCPFDNIRSDKTKK